MRCLALLLLALLSPLAMAAAIGPVVPSGDTFIGLVYHEVRSDVRDYPDPYSVDDGALVAQFAWLRGNGYTPVSLDEIVLARKGGKPLPAKAVLLSFDDAYLSFYTRVYPLLREFGFPAVLGVVGRWIDAPKDEQILYGEKNQLRAPAFRAGVNFVKWRTLVWSKSPRTPTICTRVFWPIHREIVCRQRLPAFTTLQPEPTRRLPIGERECVQILPATPG